MLCNKYHKIKSSNNWENYKQARNYVYKLKRSSLSTYFHDHCSGGCQSKHFWPTIKPFLSKKSMNDNTLDLHPFKSCGYDGITGTILKTCAHELTPPLLKLFNKSLRCGIFPDTLKKANIVPVFKSGNKQAVCNYRPVSLLPLIGQVFEKAVNKLFRNFLEPKHQYSMGSGLTCQRLQIWHVLRIIYLMLSITTNRFTPCFLTFIKRLTGQPYVACSQIEMYWSK